MDSLGGTQLLQDVEVPWNSSPLAISPNLEALLEHDERVRRGSASSGNERPEIAPRMQGLPPPPRGPRKPRSHSFTKKDLPDIPSDVESETLQLPNPFINPPPKLDPPSISSYSPSPSSAVSWLISDSNEDPLTCPTPTETRQHGVDSSTPKQFTLHTSSSPTLSNPLRGAQSQRDERHDSPVATKSTLEKFPGVALNTPEMKHNQGQPLNLSSHTPASVNTTKAFSHQSSRTGGVSRNLSLTQPSHATVSKIGALYHQTIAHQRIPERPLSPKSFIDLGAPDHPRDKSAMFRKDFLNISRPVGDLGKHRQDDLDSSTPKPLGELPNLPATTNQLSSHERTELVRRTQKLAKVFGETPGASMVGKTRESPRRPPKLSLPSKASPAEKALRHVRGAASISTNSSSTGWAHLDIEQDVNRRRHSAPMSPTQLSALSLQLSNESGHSPYLSEENQSKSASHDALSPRTTSLKSLDSPVSFIDLSDEDDSSCKTPQFVSTLTHDHTNLSLPSTPSLTAEALAEEERRRKRKKLAKLHRFLGSCVPAELALGIVDPLDDDLPLPLPANNTVEGTLNDDLVRWSRRRSNTVAALGAVEVDVSDRLREELRGEEKAISVRRAQKMEKVFGVAPPQTLYHRPGAPSPANEFSPRPSRAASDVPLAAATTDRDHKRPKSKRRDRPSSTESSRRLLGESEPEVMHSEHGGETSMMSPKHNVYTHYQHSLMSLSSIIDRDDMQSLVELRKYLNAETDDLSLIEFRRASLSSASTKSERRRSLPARNSIDSESCLATPKPNITDFQTRRRRAAKLTHFFGVDYHDLIHDVLDSIERGVEEERKRGTLRPDEFEDLLQRLQQLKSQKPGT